MTPYPNQDAFEDVCEALEQAVYEATHLSPRGDDGSHWARMSGEWLEASREALARARNEKETE